MTSPPSHITTETSVVISWEQTTALRSVDVWLQRNDGTLTWAARCCRGFLVPTSASVTAVRLTWRG
eukprot:CAMPEP_0114635564 /NCGR_PEP_ID=MMETSP0168-20121206/16545_1 /TAXON_ID=95228 ORGANISM="Vannella sp., Strain DIVA3 517/6/12" /NCGR_SAMPLE_ID=MMETSP0168 /ASSEMBLY_ACC=CAM_ASM_000044 /LENGTH=65 /DNA_ID=CAMNT_0001847269 /DNA_START=492 /DNA_END=685 /DNA_ORIENTATION=-